MIKSTSGGCDQFETSPEAIEPELLTAFCERRQTDRLKGLGLFGLFMLDISSFKYLHDM